MNPDPARSISCGLVDSIHFIDDRLNGVAAELVAENKQADFFVGGLKRPDGCFDPLHRTAVAK